LPTVAGRISFVVLEFAGAWSAPGGCLIVISLHRTGAVLLTAGIVASCATTRGSTTAGTVQPGAPGEATRTRTTEEAAGLARPRFSQPDVRFMRGMIPHHAQAIDMAALVSDRTESTGIRLLARRIDISQKDEIRLMERWLPTRSWPPAGPSPRG